MWSFIYLNPSPLQVLALHSSVQIGTRSWVRLAAEEAGVPVYAIRLNSVEHITKGIARMIGHPEAVRPLCNPSVTPL